MPIREAYNLKFYNILDCFASICYSDEYERQQEEYFIELVPEHSQVIWNCNKKTSKLSETKTKQKH